MTERRDEVMKLLSDFGPMTERAICSNISTPTRSLRIVLRNMQKAGEIRKLRSRWVADGGPVAPTKEFIEIRKRRLSEIRRINEAGADDEILNQ